MADVWAKYRREESGPVPSTGMYGTPRTQAQINAQAGRQADADAIMRDQELSAARRASLISQIPGPSDSQLRATGQTPRSAMTAAVAAPPRPPVSQAYPDETARVMRAAPVGDLSRATTQRDVRDAPGVTRYDNVNGLRSPLYTNLPGAQAMEQLRGGTVSTIGGPSTDELLARADRMRSIREGNTALRDNLSFNGGNALSRQYSQDEVIGNMARSRSRADRTAALGYYSDQNRNAANLQGRQLDAEANAALERFRAESAGNLADKQGKNALSQEELRQKGALERSQYTADQRGSSSMAAGADRIFQEYIKLGDKEGAEAFRQSLLEEMAARRERERADVPEQELADGGMVYGMDDYPSAIGYAGGGMVQGYGQTPTAAQTLPEINEYRDYANGAQRLGLQAVPFEQFLSLRQGAQQVARAPNQVQPYSAMGFANGGQIPDPNDVSGKMVVDTDPNAMTDSIPAMVDGQMPAKLDSGEFVMPEDVVKFFGTDKLNKMIAAARQGQQAAQE